MNGTIKIKGVGVISYDSDGNPAETPTLFGPEIPIKYEQTIPNRNDVIDIGDGSFAKASFIITVKDMKFDAKIIQLINSRNEIVCEKEVIDLEVLENIRRVKIVI